MENFRCCLAFSIDPADPG